MLFKAAAERLFFFPLPLVFPFSLPAYYLHISKEMKEWKARVSTGFLWIHYSWVSDSRFSCAGMNNLC